jgi:hypothetical protein
MRHALSSTTASSAPRAFVGLGRHAPHHPPARAVALPAGAAPAGPAADDGDLLRRYLATHGDDCPACGYDLSGAVAGRCPECGRELALSLREAGPLHGRRALLVLVFAWLLVAGGMNSVRSGIDVQRTAARNNYFVQMLAPTVPGAPSAPFLTTDRNAATDISVTLQNIRPLVGGARADDGSSVTIVAPTGDSQITLRGRDAARWGQLAIASALPSSGLDWTAVGWGQWARLGGWSALLVAAATGLVLLALNWRRTATPRVAHALGAIAWIGFGAYFAYHVSVFALEIV